MPKLRIGVAGAPRAASFLTGLRAYGDKTTVVAVYDPDPEARAAFAANSSVAALDRYDDMLEQVDAVIVASPQHHHVPQAVTALERGVHVLSEVPAAVSFEQARQLLAAARCSTATYMMAENYCYTRDNLVVATMARAGVFGELYFGEGQYLHEMKKWHVKPDGQRTWRYYWQVGRAGNTYPTHSIGPLLRWFADRVVAVSCVGSGRHTDREHEIDDTVLVLCRTSRVGVAGNQARPVVEPSTSYGLLQPAGHERGLRVGPGERRTGARIHRRSKPGVVVGAARALRCGVPASTLRPTRPAGRPLGS